MKRRAFLKGSIASLAGLASPGLYAPRLCAASEAKRPDTSGMSLLFVHVDGLTANAVGCYGNPVVQTPNLDRFATRATRFARCYCQSPRSYPSRCSFLTGLRPDTTGVLIDGHSLERTLPAGAPLLPDLLGRYGFRTVSLCGPSHGPKQAGQRPGDFDCTQFWEDAVPCDDPSEVPSPGDSACVEPWEPDERRVAWAAGVLAEMAREGRPFLLSLAFSEPPLRQRCPQAYLDLYDVDNIPAVRASAVQDRGIPAVATRFGRNDEASGDSADGRVTDRAAREATLAYYAWISFLDAQIGNVLDTLDRLGLSSETIVMIFGDCGFHLGEHGLWGTSTLFEQVTRVPLLVRAPGVTARQVVCEELVELVDLLSTVCDLLAVPSPDRQEGRSFVPLLCDPLQPWKRAAFTTCTMPEHLGRSVRTKRWRYTDWQTCAVSQRQFELYDLDSDPWEQTNLALDPNYRNERTILANLLQRGWQAAH